MAESIREEEGQVQKCPLCSLVYKSGKACKEHLYDKHRGHPNLTEEVKKVASDKCPYCGQPKADVSRHKQTCRARPPPPIQVVEQRMQEPVHQQMVQQQPQQQQRRRQPHKYEGASNKEMVEHFKKRMKDRQNNTESTVKMYSKVLEDMFELEEARDPEFKAFRWWVLRNDYVAMPPVNDYLAASAMGRGPETNKRICTVYTHLHKWIEEALNEAQTDPLSLHRQRATGPEDARLANKRAGATKAGQGMKEAGDSVEYRVDPSVIKDVIRVALQNPLHEETMAKFAVGEWTHAGCDARKDCTDCRCRLKIKTLQDTQNFLAMSLFIRNFGMRKGDVLNMTVGGLQEAVDALSVCPHCKSKVVYAKHKKRCHR